MVKRALVCYCVDVDACAGWLNTTNGKSANVSDVSRGIFGANEGTNRLLNLFSQHDIRATWFMPSHSILSFPKQMSKVRDAGHEIALHGYTHEYVSRLTEEQERKVMARSIEVYKQFTGKHPKGWTAPAWDVSPRSMKVLEDHGIEYDHSLMHHDSQPYWAADIPETSVVHTNYADDADTWMVPMQKSTPRNVVEIPANWNVDDWPPMQFSMKNPGTHGFVNPRDIELQWQDQFTFLYRESETFVFPISIHPQVSGRSNIVPMHERFVGFLKQHEGVEFVTCAQICDEFKAGTISGVMLETGADGLEQIRERL